MGFAAPRNGSRMTLVIIVIIVIIQLVVTPCGAGAVPLFRSKPRDPDP